MRRVAVVLALTVPLAGCDWASNGFGSVSEFFGYGGNAGLPYRATVSKQDDPRNLVVTVPVGSSVALDDFRESARFPVTRYCIANYGTSQADWVIDPQTKDWAVTFTENGAILQARCMGRA
jgi:hypothetical protein